MYIPLDGDQVGFSQDGGPIGLT